MKVARTMSTILLYIEYHKKSFKKNVCNIGTTVWQMFLNVYNNKKSSEGWWACSSTNYQPKEHKKQGRFTMSCWWMLANVEELGESLDISSHTSVIHKSWPVFSMIYKEGFTVTQSNISWRTQETGDDFSLLRFSDSLRNSLLCVTGPLGTTVTQLS